MIPVVTEEDIARTFEIWDRRSIRDLTIPTPGAANAPTSRERGELCKDVFLEYFAEVINRKVSP